MDDHHAASPDAVHEGLQHAHREGGGDGCVYGVAAAPQDFNARLRAKRVLSGDHAVLGGDHLVGQNGVRHLHGVVPLGGESLGKVSVLREVRIIYSHAWAWGRPMGFAAWAEIKKE